jgi:hypothetical protein
MDSFSKEDFQGSESATKMVDTCPDVFVQTNPTE